MRKYLLELFYTTSKNTEQISIDYQGSNPGLNKKIIIILVYTALSLSISKYFGDIVFCLDYVKDSPSPFQQWLFQYFLGIEAGNFHSLIWWLSIIICFYLVIPVFIVKLLFRESLHNYGINFKGIHKDYPLYVIMLLVMIPIVYFASSTKSFQARYPIFQPLKGHLFPLFLLWQMAYFLQFIAVEFFFRGFILHGIKYRFGIYSIFIMTIPYCMVHFGKPFGETIAAIMAGVILGTLSLKSRSIVLGVLIHYSVAISMDLFALWREGYF